MDFVQIAEMSLTTVPCLVDRLARSWIAAIYADPRTGER
jgi:hypothetical protein